MNPDINVHVIVAFKNILGSHYTRPAILYVEGTLCSFHSIMKKNTQSSNVSWITEISDIFLVHF